MKLRDINWEELFPPIDPAEDEAVSEWWLETLGQTSIIYPNNHLTWQGEGPGVYLADLRGQAKYAWIKNEVQNLVSKYGGKIVSAPLDPTASLTYIDTVNNCFVINNMPRFVFLVQTAGGFALSATRFGKVSFTVNTGYLYQKPGAENNDSALHVGPPLPPPEPVDAYEPLDDASLEQIFFNDTGLEFDPESYNMDNVHRLAALQNYFDFLTDKDYTKENPDVGRGGVDDIVFDKEQNIAYFRCLIDMIVVDASKEISTAIDRAFSEIMPYFSMADYMSAVAAQPNQDYDFLWLTFAVGNIAKQ